MSSGKQLTFQHGEVAPSQRFKATSVAYNEGVAKLRNMYIRRDGGASNRSGFRSYGVSPFQYDVTSLYNVRKIRTFAYFDENGSYCELTCVKEDGGNKLYLNGSEITTVHYHTTSYNAGVGILTPPDPSEIRFTLTKDGVFITPACYVNVVLTSDVIGYANVFIKGTGAYVMPKNETLSWSSLTVAKGYSGQAPFLPVSYLVTATMKDGRELKIINVESENNTPSAWNGTTIPAGVTLVHPHVSMQTYLKLTFTSAAVVADVKHFNFYRAAGAAGPGKSFYKLAGRVNNLIAGSTLDVSFNDYGADDPSITPPLDMVAFGNDRLPFTPFAGAECACYYQQRLLTVVNKFYAPAMKPGEIVVSKLGAPRQMSQPIISQDTGAFIFSVPISDGTGVNGMLSMERALLFTGKGVYVSRGGEQGILTPDTVNPLKISDEGCFRYIEPVMSGSRGFWVNAAKSKLMCAEFGDDGNVRVFEASIFANHFLKKGIIQLEAIGGEEDKVFLVTNDGKLVQATISDNGTFGFSLWETDGFIESIFRSKGSMYFPDDSGEVHPEILMAYVVRKGLRYLETVEIREDRYRELEMFADASLAFGTRLSIDSDNLGAPGYIKIVTWNPWADWSMLDPFGLLINIESPVAAEHDWQAEQIIKIRSNLDLLHADLFDEQDFVLHFFYDRKDSKGNVTGQRVLRYVIDKDVPAVPVEYAETENQGILVAAKAPGENPFQVNFYDDGTVLAAGSEVVTLVNATTIEVKIKSGASTANHVYTKLIANATFNTLFTATLLSGATVLGFSTTYSSSYGQFKKLHYEFQGYFTSDVPAELRDVRSQYSYEVIDYYKGMSRWAPAFDHLKVLKTVDFDLSALHQLYAQSEDYDRKIVVVAEGEILSSPLNPHKADNAIAITEDDDYYRIDFGDYYAWGYVGLPYMSEFENLDIETADNRTLTDSQKLINAVGVGFLETRGGFIGTPDVELENMEEVLFREDGDITTQTQNFSGYKTIPIPSQWSQAGRVNIKNVDPVPMTILSVYPKGIAGD